ncbi:MAG TPA: porin [Thermoanaerobaculia bacterium]|nr:porin [Thermoanaerobaculia bacterium]
MKKVLLLLCAIAAPAFAQTDLKIGGTIFADFTVNPSAANAFNVGRAYINVTGNVNKQISFRITPDVARENGSGSSLSGSQLVRLKYAYGQLALDEWTTKGSWVRAGVQQTPFLDFAEATYRYRFQGTLFAEREGFLTSSDAGLSARWVFPNDLGDVHVGYYNGEGYSRTETNDEKALQIRATVRPFVKGLAATLFVDEDHYATDAKRSRVIGLLTYEHPRVNAGIETLHADDRGVSTHGWSAWATPRLGKGWELLLRHDQMTHHHRDIAGVAYWMKKNAIMVDYDRREPDTRYGLKLQLTF